MAYNSAYTGSQVDTAVGAVREKEKAWDGKQDKLNGTEDQIVGFNASGDAVPVAPPDTGVTTFNGRTGAVTPQEGDYTADMVGARPDTWTPSAADVGAVPTSRTVNGQELSQDINLTADNVGARPSTWTPTASDVGAIPSPSGGTTGQILEKTATGTQWADKPSGGISQSEADARYLQLSGGTMTGALALPGNPTSNNQAANKAYVDSLKPTRLTVTLSASGWSGNAQTITVNGVITNTSAQDIDISCADKASADAWAAGGVWCSNPTTANQLTFTCTTPPTANINLNIRLWEVG